MNAKRALAGFLVALVACLLWSVCRQRPVVRRQAAPAPTPAFRTASPTPPIPPAAAPATRPFGSRRALGDPAADPLAHAEVLAVHTAPVDRAGNSSRVRLLRTRLKYPLIRVEEDVRRDQRTGAKETGRSRAMAADHLLVALQPGQGRAQLEALAASLGASVRRQLRRSPVFLVEFPGAAADTVPRLIEALRRADGVVAVAEPDYLVHATKTPNDPSFSSLWGMHNTGQTGGAADADIDAPEAWDIRTDAASVVVGVIDTGMDYAHPDLAANVYSNPNEIVNGIDDDGNGYIDDVRGWNFVSDHNDPMDDHNHGTHVSGSIGAIGNNGVGVVGVCWNVQLLPLKFLDATGSGFTSDALEALEYATDLGVKLTNNSWGGGGYSQTMHDAIERAGGLGAVFAAAAGNFSLDLDATADYPASYDNANLVAVAALSDTDSMAGFSSYGAATVDLGAPGVSIYSTLPGGNYGSMSGTSMACPHVAGALALLKQQFPNDSVEQWLGRMYGSVEPVAALDGRTVTGGRLNLNGALNKTFSVTPAISAAFSGPEGGPFTPSGHDYVLANDAVGAVDWTIASDVGWLEFSSSAGNIPGQDSVTVRASLAVAANSLGPGRYPATITIDVLPDGPQITRQVDLLVEPSFPYVETFDGSVEPPWATNGGVWERGVPASGPGSDHTGGGSCFGTNLAGNYPSSRQAYLDSPRVALPADAPSPVLSFWMWLDAESGYDGGRLEISVDGGAFAAVEGNELLPPYSANAVLALPGGQSGWSGDAYASWTKVELGLTAYRGQVVQFRFLFASDAAVTDLGWYIDDLTIGSASVVDVTPDGGLSAAGPVGGPFAPAVFEYTLRNSGAASASWAATTTENWVQASPASGVLAPGASTIMELSVAAAADVLGLGSHRASLVLTTDDGTIQRPLMLTAAAAFPYAPTFDGGASPDGWTTAGNGWQWGQPTSGPGADHSGSAECYATNLTGNYPNSADDFLTSPPLALGSALQEPKLSFWMWMNAETEYDGGQLQMSVDGGAFALVPSTALSAPYNDFNVSRLPYSTGWSGTTYAGWTKVEMDLTANAGRTVRCRFVFASDISISYPGWYVDDFQVVAGATGVLSVTPAAGLDSTGDVGGPFSPASIVYTVANLSATPIDWQASTPAAWLLLSPAGGTLAGGGQTTLTVGFAAAADQLAAGVYADRLSITNLTNAIGDTTRPMKLTVLPPPARLDLDPGVGFDAAGFTGGPFTPPNAVHTLSNTGGQTLNWQAQADKPWLTVSPANGALAPSASVDVTVAFNAAAAALAAGDYSASVAFRNTDNGLGDAAVTVNLAVSPLPGRLAVTAAGDWLASGIEGGPFFPGETSLGLSNVGGEPIVFSVTPSESWASAGPGAGILAPGAGVDTVIALNAGAAALAPGVHAANVAVVNESNGLGDYSVNVVLTVLPAAVEANQLVLYGMVGKTRRIGSGETLVRNYNGLLLMDRERGLVKAVLHWRDAVDLRWYRVEEWDKVKLAIFEARRPARTDNVIFTYEAGDEGFESRRLVGIMGLRIRLGATTRGSMAAKLRGDIVMSDAAGKMFMTGTYLGRLARTRSRQANVAGKTFYEVLQAHIDKLEDKGYQLAPSE